MLTRIHIDNHKCLTNFDLRLDNLTLLAGANGCGKSAIFEVMGKLRDFAHGDRRVDKLFRAAELTRWTTKREQRFELEFSDDAGTFLYSLAVEHRPDNRGAYVKFERLLYDSKPLLSLLDKELRLYHDDYSEGPLYPFAPSGSALATVSDERDYSRLHHFRDLMCGLQTLSLTPSRIVGGSDSESDVLAHDGENFAAWYRGQILNDPHHLQQVTLRLQDILPGFTGLKQSARSGDHRELLASFVSAGDEPSRSYRFGELSDGQRALIVLYSLVFETIPDTVRIPVKPITRSGGKPITCSGANRSPVPTQTDHLSERSDAGRNHESRFSVRVDGRLRFRIESPFRSSLYALCTRRSRIALASVGSPMTSCHLRLPPISRTG